MVDFSAVDRAVLKLQLPADATIYYTPAGGARVKVDDAIFTNPDVPVEGADLIFEGTGPQFAVHSADVPNLAVGDVLEISTVNYTVTKIDKGVGFLWKAFCRKS